MIRTMLRSLREFKKPTLLTLGLMVAEVLIDVLIPFYTADLVNRVKAGVPMNEVLIPGLILVMMAILSLFCGGAAGVTGARASAGFATPPNKGSGPIVRGLSLRARARRCDEGRTG